MALDYVSGTDSLTESLHSQCSLSVRPTDSAYSQNMSASPSSENPYSEIGVVTGASGSTADPSSPEYGTSTRADRSLRQHHHGSAHELRTGHRTAAPPTAPRHRSADVLGPTPLAAHSAHHHQHHQHQPRIMNPRHQRVPPPKPRRLYIGHDLYTMPTPSPEKRHHPLDERRAWSPMAPAAGGGHLNKLRCFRSNEQLDAMDGDSERLDTISNSSAPPKIAPHSGKLNKMSPDDIIKPVAFKPIITPANHFSPCRPSPSQSVLPGRQQHLTSDLNRSHDDGYQSQDGNHVSHQDSAAGQPLQRAPVGCSFSSSQCNGQIDLVTCHTNQTSSEVKCASQRGLFDGGHPSTNASHVSLDRSHVRQRHTNGASLDRATRALYGMNQASVDAGRSSSEASGASNGGSQLFRGGAHAAVEALQPSGAHPSHGSPELIQSCLNTSRTSHTSSNLSHACSSDGSHVSSQITSASCHASPACVYGSVDDIETLLKHKEAELRHLRETMDRNERALLQVYEEKRQNWEAELRDRCNDWQQKLDAAYHKSFRTEQALLIQLFKLQEERRALRKDNEQLQHANRNLEQRCTDLEQQLKQASAHADELNWELQQRSGEISLLKSHLKDEKEQVSSRSAELVNLRAQVKELREERDRLSEDLQRVRDELKESVEQSEKTRERLTNELDQSKWELEKLREENAKEKISAEEKLRLDADRTARHEEELRAVADELAKTRSRLAEAEEAFSRERSQWLTEKDKVIRYQKHLQLNYIQAMRKNKLLEDDVEQLTLELEQHNIKLMARAASVEEATARASITLMEEEESIC